MQQSLPSLEPTLFGQLKQTINNNLHRRTRREHPPEGLQKHVLREVVDKQTMASVAKQS